MADAVKTALTPYLKEKVIGKDVFKEIAKRAVDKVVSHDKKQSGVDEKRKAKIEALVGEYVAKVVKDAKKQH